jgi:alkanesulfonate monooxygenase SsuD/methylene tetrahydromethanopterin reductase-like flavin-dependent oxidoreductase (luciferase family)
MAQSVGSLAQAAPGRFVFGIGTSSDVIVERWNGIPFEEPYKQVRDMVRFLRTALTGEKVKAEYESFTVRGFKLGVVPEQPVPILIAALREGMLNLAGREAMARSSTGCRPTT